MHDSTVLDIRPADLRDAALIAPHLRPEDRREMASTHPAPVDFVAVLARAIGASTSAFTAFDRETGHPVCVGGVAPRGDGSGSVWMFGTVWMRGRAIALARVTPSCIKRLHSDYRMLTNWADTRNTLHINWLRWAGFRFLRTSAACALDGSPFVEFFKDAEDV